MNAFNGYALEQIINPRSVARACHLKKFPLPSSPVLFRLLRQCYHGRKWLSRAMPYLMSEYGIETGGVKLVEASIPESVIADYVLGLDAVYNWKGHIIGIDWTTNDDATGKKADKQESLALVYTALGLDHVATIVCNRDVPRGDIPAAIEAAMRKVIKGDKVVYL